MSDFLKVTLWGAMTALFIYAGVKLDDWSKDSHSQTWLLRNRDRMARNMLQHLGQGESTVTPRKWVVVGVNKKRELCGFTRDETNGPIKPTDLDVAQSRLGLDCLAAYAGNVYSDHIEWFDVTPNS